jgi:hypothetical protein
LNYFIVYFNASVDIAGEVTLISPAHLLMTMTQDEQEHKEILHEIEALCIMHEKITQSSECREFSGRCALLLQRLEDGGFSRLADRAMDLLVSCNPKDLSQCDKVRQASNALERLRDQARESFGK